MLCPRKPYYYTSSDELTSWISHAESEKFPRKEKTLMAFHFLSKTPPSQLWLRHWFSKANNSSACVLGSARWLCFLGWVRGLSRQLGGWFSRMGPAHEARQEWNPDPCHHGCSPGTHSASAASTTPHHFSHWTQFDFSPPGWVLLCTTSCPVPAVCQRKLHCPRCTDPPSIPNATCHYFREIQGTNFSTFISPLISLPLSDLLLRFQKTIDFYFIGKQQNWNKWLLAEHIFCFTENLSAWCPWNAQCD